MTKRILFILAILAVTGSILINPIFTSSAEGADGLDPDGVIDFPLGNLTINAGGAIYFEGTGTSDNASMSFDWDFGGGATDSTLEDPGFVVFPNNGIFVVTFTVTDDEFRSDPTPDTRTITVNPPGGNALPAADAGGPYAAYAGDTINFDATASSDSDGSIVTYQWDFGDTTNAVGATPSKSYSIIGSYSLVLTVIDDDGAVDTDTIIVDIFPPGAPVALFSATPTSGALPLTVVFTDDSLTQDTIVGWDWDFGDSTSSTLQNPSHDYTLDGTYDVTLTITEASTASDTLTKTSFIVAGTGIPLDPDRWTGPGLIVGRCFIATAAYGSYFDPHVLVLRDLRDRLLVTNGPGRAFVKLYYRLSPSAAEFISRRPWLKSITRGALMPLVYLSKFVLYTSGIQKFIVLAALLSLAIGVYAFKRKWLIRV